MILREAVWYLKLTGGLNRGQGGVNFLMLTFHTHTASLSLTHTHTCPICAHVYTESKGWYKERNPQTNCFAHWKESMFVCCLLVFVFHQCSLPRELISLPSMFCNARDLQWVPWSKNYRKGWQAEQKREAGSRVKSLLPPLENSKNK